MKVRILTLLFLVGIGCKNVTKEENRREKMVMDSTEPKVKSHKEENANLISTGIWISTIDTLSTVEIKGKSWVFKYKNVKTTTNDYYKYSINESVFDRDSSIINGSLVLTNQLDTLTYGIEYISDKTMNLIYLQRGNFQRFRKKE